MKSGTLALSLCTAVGSMPWCASADEPLVGFVYTTDLLPQGQFEVAQWLTLHERRPAAGVDTGDGSTEFEYGLSDRLQVSAYLNYARQRTGATSTRYTGTSVEAIYRAFSPYVDPLGVALSVRPTVGPQFQEIESRLILQKNYFDDRLVLAFNASAVLTSHHGSGGAGDTGGVNVGAAASLRFAPGWSAGAELQNDAAYYFGPSLHFAGRHFFATGTYVDRLQSADADRFRVRLKLGWYF